MLEAQQQRQQQWYSVIDTKEGLFASFVLSIERRDVGGEEIYIAVGFCIRKKARGGWRFGLSYS
jgi:hypothetical protein